MAKFKKGDSQNARKKVKGFNLEEWHLMTGEWMPEIVECVREGMAAVDKDGHPDYNARFKFVQLVLNYNLGKPKESMSISTQEFAQIIVGDLKGNDND